MGTLGTAWAAMALALCFSVKGRATPTLESVAQLATRTTSLEEVVTELGKAYPELRENFVLMHESKSRQRASYEFPRVISHLNNGRFVMAFNSDPALQGYDELEMLEFATQAPQRIPEGFAKNYESEGFRFRRIIFDSHQRKAPEVRPINEALCQGCHGHANDLRPNWESYSIWEGAYPRTDFAHPGEKYRFGYRTDDHDGFDLFYTRQAGRGRFAFLRGLEAQFVNGHPSEKYGLGRVAPSQFTQTMGYLNYRRVAHRILESTDYQAYRFAILGGLYNCEEYQAFFPPNFETTHSLQWYLDSTEKSFNDDENRFHLDGDYEGMGKLRYVMEGRNQSMFKWSMSFRRSPYSFVTPGGSMEGFIAGVMMEYDRELTPYRVFDIIEDKNYGHTTEFSLEWTGSMRTQTKSVCDALKEKSRTTLGGRY